MHLPIAFAAYLFPDSLYETLWHTQKHFTGHAFVLNLCCVLAVAIGSIVGSDTRKTLKTSFDSARNPFGDWSLYRLRTIVLVSFAFTLIGSVVWVLSALRNGLTLGVVARFFAQEASVSDQIKADYFTTIPGVTTLAQCAIAATIASWLLYNAKKEPKMRLVFLFIVGLNAVRAFLLSERLALIEVVVPIVVLQVHFMVLKGRLSRMRKTFLRLAPALAVILLFFAFTGMEVFRSWTFYSSKSDSLLEFGAARLTGYYVTAVNNSALLLDAMPDSELPVFTQMWLWKMPIVRDVVGNSAEVAVSNYEALLSSFGNRELNNPGGFLVAMYDFGIVGGLFYWLLCGLLFGRIYLSFRNSEITGLLLYPFTYVGVLELSRVLYLSDGRAFPSLALLVAATFYLRRSKKTRRKTVEFDHNAFPVVDLA